MSRTNRFVFTNFTDRMLRIWPVYLLCLFLLNGLWAQNVVPIHGWSKYHHIQYALNYPDHTIFFGGINDTLAIIRMEDGNEYYLSEFGKLFNVSKDGNSLFFEKATITITKDSLKLTKTQNKMPGTLINRYALCYRYKKDRYWRLGRKFKLPKKLKNFFKKNRDNSKLIDLDKKHLILRKDKSLIFFDGKELRQIPLLNKGKLNTLWWNKDSLKIGYISKSILPGVVRKVILLYRHSKANGKDSLLTQKPGDFLSPTDGTLIKERSYTPSPDGIFPIGKDHFYLSLESGIFSLFRQKNFWRLMPILPLNGYVRRFLSLESTWLVVDSKGTHQFKDKKWEKSPRNLYFVGFYDSTLVYQLGQQLVYYPKISGMRFNTRLSEGEKTTFLHGESITVISKQNNLATLDRLKIIQGQLHLLPISHFCGNYIHWIVPLKRLALPIKYNWNINCSLDEYTFKEISAQKENILSVLSIKQTLFVLSKNNRLCIIPLLKQGKTRYPFSVFSIKYAFGSVILFSDRGLEIGSLNTFSQ